MGTDIAVATMTLARSPHEAAELAGAIECLAAFGAAVTVTDGGSHPALVARLAAVPGVSVLRSAFGPGLVGQMKTSLDAAARRGARFICYTEPDKHQFFTDGFSRLVGGARLSNSTGVVLAARTPEAFDTFPPFQQYTERAINDLASEVVGRPGDYSYGPFIINAALVRHVLTLAPDVGWGWRHFAFGMSRRIGLDVELIEGHFVCPPHQRTEDRADRLHRVQQLEQNSRGLVLSQTVPLPGV